MKTILLYQQEGEMGEFFTLSMLHPVLKSAGVDVHACNLSELDKVRDSVVFVVKFIAPELATILRKQNNKIVLDMVDMLAHMPMENVESYLGWLLNQAGVDKIIVRQKFLAQALPDRLVYIPQHYDVRLDALEVSTAPNTESTKIAFPYSDPCGSRLHTDYPELFDVVSLDGQAHNNPDAIMDMHLRLCQHNFYNSHRQTDSSGYWFKPATKTATAAALGRNVIVNRDKSVEDLLPEDYPYTFTDGDFLSFYETKIKVVNVEEYAYGIECMKQVKQQTSISNQADQYIKIING